MTADEEIEMDKQTRAALKPSRMLAGIRRISGPIWLRTGIAAVLEVRGRRTGGPVLVTLIPWEVDGKVYLMSQ
jgi:hypothetical protein